MGAQHQCCDHCLNLLIGKAFQTRSTDHMNYYVRRTGRPTRTCTNTDPFQLILDNTDVQHAAGHRIRADHEFIANTTGGGLAGDEHPGLVEHPLQPDRRNTPTLDYHELTGPPQHILCVTVTNGAPQPRRLTVGKPRVGTTRQQQQGCERHRCRPHPPTGRCEVTATLNVLGIDQPRPRNPATSQRPLA